MRLTAELCSQLINICISGTSLVPKLHLKPK